MKNNTQLNTSLVVSKQKTVIICPDVYNKSTWSHAQVDDVCAYLAQQFTVFPENTRIYHNAVAQQNDVTPKRPQDIEQLQTLDGTFYVVIYPAEAVAIGKIIYYVVMAIMAAYSVYTIMTMPKPQGQQMGSSNNELQGRTNKARLKGRIPDIYGTQRSYPDLVAVTYSFYNDDGREVEEALMCIGRGYYQIHDMKDAQTRAEGIPDMNVSVFDPDKSIIGSDTIYRTGAVMTELPLRVTKSASINGQSLKKPNVMVIENSDSIYFETSGVVKTTDTAIDFTSLFEVGDGIEIQGAVFGVGTASLGGQFLVSDDYTITINSTENIANITEYQKIDLTGATFTYSVTVDDVTTEYTTDISGEYDLDSVSVSESGGVYTYVFTLIAPKSVNYNWNYITSNTISMSAKLSDSTLGMNLDGVYSIGLVQEDQFTLSNVEIINDEWEKLDSLFAGSTAGASASISIDLLEDKWVGWFDIEDNDATELVVNIYFPQGLYNTTNEGKTGTGWAKIEIQHRYENDSTVYSTFHTESRTGNKDTFGITIRVPIEPGRSGISFRLAKVDEKRGNAPVAECKVKDVYLAHEYPKSIYEGVTMVRAQQVATDGALSMKERKLNCLVTRKLRVNGTGELVATRDAGQAIINMALDAHEGRRSTTEIDTTQILAEILKISTYFNSTIPTEFNYTFDDSNVSFEEAVGMVASAVFCESYRFGNKLRIRFEQPQASSVLLFNHRNKVIGSEKRTYKFGIDKDYDGIKLEYTSPDDDERVNYYLSYNASTDTLTEDDSATNPLEITTSGIRSHAVAKIRAWREWNKLRYHTVSCEFTGLDESHLLIRNDRILNADNTEVDTQDGQVEFVDGLTLTLSQDVEFVDGVTHYCHLQLSDGTVEVIEVTAGEFTNQVDLVSAPRLPLVYDDDRYVKTLYTIVRDDEAEREAFMMTELSPDGQMTNKLTCINYSDDYYKNDHDFI